MDTTLRKNIIRLAILVAGLLMIPLVAMQFTNEVNWTITDFIAAGALLFGAGLIYLLVAKQGGTFAYRAAVGVGCAAGLLLLWINLAVGIIGGEDHPANAMYLGVIATALIGIAIARFSPRGMTRAMLATAVAQLIVPVLAIIIWREPLAIGVVQILGLNAMFVVLWVVSAMLFRHAGDTDPKWLQQTR